jgi:hypothetical protein
MRDVHMASFPCQKMVPYLPLVRLCLPMSVDTHTHALTHTHTHTHAHVRTHICRPRMAAFLWLDSTVPRCVSCVIHAINYM